jgi:GTP-binding protein HflX
MTNAKNENFSLEAELDETAGWDLDDPESEIALADGDDWTSGYADEPDPEEWPEDAELTVGMQDLAERHALRRVAGLSTELEDISEVEYRQLRLERVVLVGVWTTRSVEDAENSMTELALLAETAGSTVLDAIYQRRNKPDPATYIGRGKVDGLKEMVQATGAGSTPRSPSCAASSRT